MKQSLIQYRDRVLKLTTLTGGGGSCHLERPEIRTRKRDRGTPLAMSKFTLLLRIFSTYPVVGINATDQILRKETFSGTEIDNPHFNRDLHSLQITANHASKIIFCSKLSTICQDSQVTDVKHLGQKSWKAQNPCQRIAILPPRIGFTSWICYPQQTVI